jgi:hypothetical protein
MFVNEIQVKVELCVLVFSTVTWVSYRHGCTCYVFNFTLACYLDAIMLEYSIDNLNCQLNDLIYWVD